MAVLLEKRERLHFQKRKFWNFFGKAKFLAVRCGFFCFHNLIFFLTWLTQSRSKIVKKNLTVKTFEF